MDALFSFPDWEVACARGGGGTHIHTAAVRSSLIFIEGLSGYEATVRRYYSYPVNMATQMSKKLYAIARVIFSFGLPIILLANGQGNDSCWCCLELATAASYTFYVASYQLSHAR